MGSSAERVRWGIVGTGGISRQIAADFAFVAEAEVVAVSSRDAGKAQEFAAEYGIRRWYEGVDDLLASDIDAVYIGTPHRTHFEIAVAAIRAGKHVLCEKPLALDATEVRELTALAREAGVFLMEAMWMAFNPLIRRLHELVEDGVLGELRSVQASFGAAFPRDDSSRWMPGGSTLLDQGIYPVSLAHQLLGRPDSVHAAGTVRGDGVDLRGRFTLGYSGDRFAQGAFSMVEWLDSFATVSGTDAWVTTDRGFWYASQMTVHHPLGRGQRRDEVVEVEREGFGYAPMLRATATSILGGALEHRHHNARDTIDVFETLDEIRRQFSAPTREHA